MKYEVRIASPAKINLHLDVGAVRADGYHSLHSIFQMVSFGDELFVRSLKDDGVCEIHGDFDVPPSRNTIMKAVMKFREACGIHDGLSISVRKRIPCGTGMGGGSSNAAATLRALDSLFSTELGTERLVELAADIGSDVPFFCSSPAAYVTGRGEVLESIKARSDFFALLVHPGFGVSTADAYRWLDQDRKAAGWKPDEHPGTSRHHIRSYLEEDIPSWRFFNSFFPTVRDRHPRLEDILVRLYREGADYACMSGSGSMMFGLFSSRSRAETAAQVLGAEYPLVVIAEMLDRMPNAVLQ